ncbi:hypothetical protein DNH61_12335 [Paenibacillus sambharensis]|uniref:DUF4025 domain-containing protein n=1 Tax=Paenibacillus sambharensis TaxID=1803190 RepID=A0A2W1L5D9_9BACL|nr:hypothetical protein [Paenibacillus sambharensis]PZD95328.1 hypothetical protein DNH61_12335 [Paenibacillus sambharensis]
MSNRIEEIRADQQNFLDKTDDEVKEVPSHTTTNDDAVEAMVSHLNKYDEQEEYQKPENQENK